MVEESSNDIVQIAADSAQIPGMVDQSSNDIVQNAVDSTQIQMLKNPGITPPNPHSKRQLKKLRKAAVFQEKRKEKRLKEREKQKEKRKLAVAQGLPAQSGPSRKELKKRQATLSDKTASFKVAIDLDYDDIMTDHDIAKCVKQCLRIYTVNRRSQHPGQIHFTGLKKNGRIHNAFNRHDGWENWNVCYHFDETHVEKFKRDEIIYLTCESDNVLNELEVNKIYCIGGLVDHNHHKGVCHERAVKAELKTARLPLSEHVDMKTRSVLSTYHVFELLLSVAGGSSWTDAILATVPMRKGAKPKAADQLKIDTREENVEATNIECDKQKIVETESNKSLC